jgi:hypothetical protein
VPGFTLSGTNWVQESALASSDPQFESSFGSAVALNGSTAMVGAPLFDRYGNSDIGQVTVFDGATAVQALDRGDGIADDLGGYSVSVSGDTVSACWAKSPPTMAPAATASASRWPWLATPWWWARPAPTSPVSPTPARPTCSCAAATPGPSRPNSPPATS